MESQKNILTVPVSIVLAAVIIGGAVVLRFDSGTEKAQSTPKQAVYESSGTIPEWLLPSAGVVLPVSWGDLGRKLGSVGALDAQKLQALYEERGEFSDEHRKLLYEDNSEKLKLTRENAGFLLNLFWALGLASKNPILDSGEMQNPLYGGAGNFASTAGWILATGNAMEHYSRHRFFNLTTEEQSRVERVAKGIYRPCCGNSVHFPDCNHGMAMLGLLELMASQGVNEEEMWKAALAVNSFWFPDTYETIAAYMKGKGVEWKDVSPKEVLGRNFSSAEGFARIASQMAGRREQGNGSSCGVQTGGVAAPIRQESGCGI